MLCGSLHEFLKPAPEWSDQIEAEEVAKRASEGGSEAVSIVWTNRGDAGDNFDSIFGTSDNAARAVVDAVLDAWERVITSFNRADGTSTLRVTNNIGGTGGPVASWRNLPKNLSHAVLAQYRDGELLYCSTSTVRAPHVASAVV